MFRRSRLSVRPNVSTTGRTGAASQEPPPSTEDSAEANIQAETPVSATDPKPADEPITQTPGDANEQHGETAAASAIQRRKRFSVKPKVLPGRPSAPPRTPKSPIKPTLPPAKSPAPVVDKADAPIEENSTTAPPQETEKDARLPTTDNAGSGKNVHKPEDSVNIQPCNKAKEISPKTAPVPRSIPDREAIEISEKAKTLVSKANLAASSQKFSLTQLLNDKSDLVRLEKARKLRQLLKQEMLKGKTKKAKGYIKEHCLDPSKMTMRDLIRYLPTANPMSTSLESQQENETFLPPSPARQASPERVQEAEVQPKIFSPSQAETINEASAAAEEEEEQQQEQQEEEEEVVVEEEDGEDEDGVMVPQVKVAEDGSLIIDEESLTVEVQRMKGPNTIQDRDPIFERGSTTTYSSFRKGTHTKPWSMEETDMFFLAISMVGTDFSMICQLFPHRARSEIKNKFKKEERHNAWRIDKAFRERRRLDLEYFKKLLQKIIEYQESKKKLKAVREKNKTPRKRKAKSGKKDTVCLSDVEEEVEDDISNEEQEGEKENLCNKTTSDSRTKRKRKDRDDASPESKAEKKKRKKPTDDEATPAENLQEETETPESDKSTEATLGKPLLGRKARKAPKSKAIVSDKGESTSDETVEAQIIVDLPKTTNRLSDNESDQEVTVLSSKPTRSGRISKPVQSLNYPAKEDRHSSASDGALTSPGRDAASKPKSKTQGKRRLPQKQAAKESKKPTLITLRASQSEESDDEEEAHAPHWDEENSKDAFVPASLCSPKPVVVDVEETMEELLPHDIPDVLGMSANALFPDATCELEHNDSGSIEPCEHQLDLLVDVIDFLSEHTEASEDEAAQTLLAIRNVSNLPQLTDGQAAELDHTSSIEGSICIEVDDASISFQLEDYNESLQPSTVEISQTSVSPAPHTSNRSEEEPCSTQEKSPPAKKGRFTKIKPKPNLGSRATKPRTQTVCVKETKPIELETTATSQPQTSDRLESTQDEPEPSQTENSPTNDTTTLMPSPQTGYEPYEAKETTMPPVQIPLQTSMSHIQTVTLETSVSPEQNVTAETSLSPEQKVTPETSLSPEQNVTAETSLSPEQKVTPETSLSPKQKVTPETTMSPKQKVSPETSLSPKQKVTPEMTLSPKQKVTPEMTLSPKQKVTPETSLPPKQKVTPETTMSSKQKVSPETSLSPTQNVTPETTMSPKQKVSPETPLSPKQKVTPEMTLSPKQKVTPQTTMSPKQKVTPETSLSPKQKVTPETSLSPKQKVTPETTMSSKQKVTPETTLFPKQKVTPETTLSPKQKVTPETSLSPKQKVTLQTTMSPIQTVTLETSLSPKQKVTPETSLSPKQKVTPETSLSPKQKVTPETTLSPKQKVTPETSLSPKQKVTPETPLSPKQKVTPRTIMSPIQTVTLETSLPPKQKVTPETSLSPKQKVTPELTLSPKQTETAKSTTTKPGLVGDLGTSKQSVEAVCDDITTTIPSLKHQEESALPILEKSSSKNEAVSLTNEMPEAKSSQIKPSDDTCRPQESTAAPEPAIQSAKTSALPRKGRLPKIKPKPNIGRSSRIKSGVDPEEKINLECVTAATSEAQPAPAPVSETELVPRNDTEKQTDPGSDGGSETDLGLVKEKCVASPSVQCEETPQKSVKPDGKTMRALELGNKNLTQTDPSSEREKTDKPAQQSNPNPESSKFSTVQKRRWIPKVKPKLVSSPRTAKSKVEEQDKTHQTGTLLEHTPTTSHLASPKPDTATRSNDAGDTQQALCRLISTTTDLTSPAASEPISIAEKTTAEQHGFSENLEIADKITEACGSNQRSMERCQPIQRLLCDSVDVHQAEGHTFENQGISQSRDSDMPMVFAGVSTGGAIEPSEPQRTEAAAGPKTFDYQHVFADMLPDQIPSDPDEPFFILSLTEIPVCPSGEVMEEQQRNPVEPVLPAATGANISLSDIYIPTPEKAALGSDLIRVEEYLPSAHSVDMSIFAEPQANPSRRTLILAEEDNSKDNKAEASPTETPVKGLGETKSAGKAAAKEANQCSDKDVTETTTHPSLTSETKRKPSEIKGSTPQNRKTKATRELQKEPPETQSSKTMLSSSIIDQLSCFSSESSDLIDPEEGPTDVSESFYSDVFTTVDGANVQSTTKDSAGPEKPLSKPVETKETRKKQRKVDSSNETQTAPKVSLTENNTAVASLSLQENRTSSPKRTTVSCKKNTQKAPGKRTGKSKSSNEAKSSPPSRLQRTRVAVKSTVALSLDPQPSPSITVTVPTRESNQQSSSSSEPQVCLQSDSFDGSLSEDAPTNVTQFFLGDIFTEVTNDDGPTAEMEAQATETMKTKTQSRIAKASGNSLSGHSSSLTEAKGAKGAGAKGAGAKGAGVKGAGVKGAGAKAAAAVGAGPNVECSSSLIQTAPDPSKAKAKKTRGKGPNKNNKPTISVAQPQDQHPSSCGVPEISGSKKASPVRTLSDKEPTPVSQPLADAAFAEVETTHAQTTQGKSRQKRKTRASSVPPSLEPNASTEERHPEQTEPQTCVDLQSESKGTRGKPRNKKPTVGATARRSRPQRKSAAEPPQTSPSEEPQLPLPDPSDANEGFDDEPTSVSQYFLSDVFTEVDDKL